MTHPEQHCPVETTLRIIGGKWKPLILYFLLQDTRRFSELRRLVPGVTQQMLTSQLRELEADGIIRRQVYAQVPPKVEYSLTETGRSLQPLLDWMLEWGKNYLQEHGQELVAEPGGDGPAEKLARVRISPDHLKTR